MDGEIISDPVRINKYVYQKATVNVTSFLNSGDPVTVSLTKSGGITPLLSKTAAGNSAKIVFDKVPVGTYTITISKKDHAKRVSSLVILSTAATSFQIINPIGDINGDGNVTTIDCAMARVTAIIRTVVLTGIFPPAHC